MSLELEPVRIVECPPSNSASPWKRFRGPGHRRPTGRTKFHFHPMATFVRAIFIGVEYASCNCDVFLIKVCRHSKGAPGSALAKPTMAYYCHVRIPHDLITNCSTKTTTFMCFRHFVTLVLSVSLEAYRPQPPVAAPVSTTPGR